MGNGIEEGRVNSAYCHERFTYYPTQAVVEVKGQRISLTATENMLMFVLSESPNEPVEHEDLISMGWPGRDENLSERSISYGLYLDMQVLRISMMRLRKKIDNERKIESPIKISWGVGYTLVDPSRPVPSE